MVVPFASSVIGSYVLSPCLDLDAALGTSIQTTTLLFFLKKIKKKTKGK